MSGLFLWKTLRGCVGIFGRRMENSADTPLRKIIHVDMDAYYASVEQRDNPQLRGKPIAVGGSPTGRGVVATASYEARKFGIRSAMPSATAIRRCPDLIFVRPRFEVYREVSRHIREIFRRYSDLIEPLSLDEAFLDVTDSKSGHSSAIYMAQQIRAAIRSELNLTATAGVSYCKFLAKIASDLNKPDGLTFISPEQAIPFLENLAIEKFFGIGKKTAEKMKKMGIHSGKDLKERSRPELLRRFGKSGGFFYDIVRGIDNRPVRPNRPMKSASVEDTFRQDIEELDQLDEMIETLSERLFRRLAKKEIYGRTVTLKVKFADFTQVTRSKTLEQLVETPGEFIPVCKALLRNTEAGNRPVRLIGVGTSNFEDETDASGQLKLELEFPEE